ASRPAARLHPHPHRALSLPHGSAWPRPPPCRHGVRLLRGQRCGRHPRLAQPPLALRRRDGSVGGGAALLQWQSRGRAHPHGGGEARIVEEHGRRAFFEQHRFPQRLLHEVGAQLRREPTELVEFHCKLLRREAFDKFDFHEPRFLSCAESLDLCLQLRQAGYPVMIEPSAVVSNLQPPPFAWSDLPFYLLRWSDAWNRISLQRFRELWDLPADDWWVGHHYRWLTNHRRLATEWIAGQPRKLLGWRRGTAVADLLIHAVERREMRRFFR